MKDPDRRRTIIRFGLWYLAITTAYVAVWILVDPRGFYDTFPTGPAEWVSALPPFNEHLERDFGAAGLGLAVLAAFAALRPERRLVQATGLAFIASATPHLVYHLTTTDSYSTSDNVQSLIGLVLPIVVSLVVLAMTREPRTAAEEA